MDSNDRYLTHCAGLYALFAWMNAQDNIGMPCQNNGQIIYIHPLISRYFSLGISRSKGKSHLPFLAVQPIEKKWICLIQWDCILVRSKDKNIYLVSKLVKGDGSEFPDIPSFAIALNFDTLEKIDLLSGVSTLQCREYSKDYTGQINVNFHGTIFSLPIKVDADEVLFDLPQSLTYDKLMLKNEENLQHNFSDGEPEFKGNQAAIPGTEGLFEKLKKKLL